MTYEEGRVAPHPNSLIRRSNSPSPTNAAKEGPQHRFPFFLHRQDSKKDSHRRRQYNLLRRRLSFLQNNTRIIRPRQFPRQFFVVIASFVLLVSILFGGSSSSIRMVRSFFPFPRQRAKPTSPATTMSMQQHAASLPSSSYDKKAMQSLLETALWSFFAGDALASPTHWFYGGLPQIKQIYGKPIAGYVQPNYELPGSILNKSNLSGGGRSGGGSSSTKDTIIGNVINHGKADLWNPNKSIHYHATLHAGENTLEVSLARVLMKTVISLNGKFDADAFRQNYIQFMTTPQSHNDTYASTCHRMFFANYHYKHLDPKDCPDNDSHNVDTIDGLVLPTITSLAVAAHPTGTLEEARAQARQTVSVTRNSRQLEAYASEWAALIFDIARNGVAADQAAKAMAKSLRLRSPRVQARDEITACYLDTACPALLDSLVKYHDKASVWDGLLANANTGGENVHRGSCLGAVLGMANHRPPEPQLVQGLYHAEELKREIRDFVRVVTEPQS